MNKVTSGINASVTRNLLPLSAIAVSDIAETRDLTIAICRELHRRFGSSVYAYVYSQSACEYYQTFVDEGFIKEVILVRGHYVAADKPVTDVEAVFARARENEKFLGTTYNSIRMVHRGFGHGFYLGGFNHPVSYYSVKPTYPQIVNAYNHLIDFWRSEYETRGISLHLNGQKDAAVVAHAYKVPYRLIYSARVDNLYYWGVNEMIDYPGVEAAYRAIESQEFEPLPGLQQYHLDVGQRRRIVGQRPLLRLTKRMAWQIVKAAYLRKNRDKYTKSYYLSSMLRYIVREHLDLRRLRPPYTQSLEALTGVRFVYFPLHTEPEQALHQFSPECFDQLGTIAAIARDLPADVMLVVKETIYGAGRRPHDFYEQIKRLRNTVLLDVHELGTRVVEAANVVVTMAGTAGLEAAQIGKPVLLFGRHNYYSFLPHVRAVRQSEELKPALDWALGPEFDHTRARRDGARLREAIKRSCFDLGAYSNIDVKKFTMVEVRRATDSLLRGLSIPAESLA
jgi:hypothetical protein